MTNSISRSSIFQAEVKEVPFRPKPIEVIQLIEGAISYINSFENFELHNFEINFDKLDGRYSSDILCFGDFCFVPSLEQGDFYKIRKKLYINGIKKKIQSIDDKLYSIPFLIELILVWKNLNIDLLVVSINNKLIGFRSVVNKSGNRIQVRNDDGSIGDYLI